MNDEIRAPSCHLSGARREGSAAKRNPRVTLFVGPTLATMLRLLDPLYSDADELAQSVSLMAEALRSAIGPSGSRRAHRPERIIKTER
jgi:hypothetical protein